MKNKQYKTFINSVCVDINPLLHDVLYIVEYGSEKTRYYFLCDLSYNLSKRIHNFISTGILTLADNTLSVYKYGLQNYID